MLITTNFLSVLHLALGLDNKHDEDLDDVEAWHILSNRLDLPRQYHESSLTIFKDKDYNLFCRLLHQESNNLVTDITIIQMIIIGLAMLSRWWRGPWGFPSPQAGQSTPAIWSDNSLRVFVCVFFIHVVLLVFMALFKIPSFLVLVFVVSVVYGWSSRLQWCGYVWCGAAEGLVFMAASGC